MPVFLNSSDSDFEAGFLRMLLIGLLLQVILQRYPNGILPETRPAAPGKQT